MQGSHVARKHPYWKHSKIYPEGLKTEFSDIFWTFWPKQSRRSPEVSRTSPEVPQTSPEVPGLPRRSAPFSGKPDTLSWLTKTFSEKGNVDKMSETCRKKCPKIVQRDWKHTIFSHFFGQFWPIWSMLLFGDPVQCSPVTTVVCAAPRSSTRREFLEPEISPEQSYPAIKSQELCDAAFLVLSSETAQARKSEKHTPQKVRNSQPRVGPRKLRKKKPKNTKTVIFGPFLYIFSGGPDPGSGIS